MQTVTLPAPLAALLAAAGIAPAPPAESAGIDQLQAARLESPARRLAIAAGHYAAAGRDCNLALYHAAAAGRDMGAYTAADSLLAIAAAGPDESIHLIGIRARAADPAAAAPLLAAESAARAACTRLMIHHAPYPIRAAAGATMDSARAALKALIDSYPACLQAAALPDTYALPDPAA